MVSRRACGDRQRQGERCGLGCCIERDATRLCFAAGRDRHLGEIDLRGVQRDRRRRLREDDIDRLATAKRFLLEVGRKPECVVLGYDVAGKPLCAGGDSYKDNKKKESCNSDHYFKVTEPETVGRTV